jgi:glycosyltransferase involved in cell wall biosynthesis
VRILYILPAEGFGGAERQGVTHIRTLLELGFEVVPVVGPGKTICHALEREGVRDYVFMEDFLTESDRPLSLLEQIGGKLRAPQVWLSMQHRFQRLLEARAIELVFASRSYGWVVGSAAARKLGVPLIWRGGSRITSSMETAGVRFLGSLWPPDALVCNCEAVRRDLAPLLHCPSFIVPNGVDVHRFDPARVEPRLRTELGLPAEVPVVGLAARPAPEKGLELLAEVVGCAVRRVPNLRVLIGGEFGWRGYYQQLFDSLGLGQRVTFLGHLNDVECLYKSCDVMVLTSPERSIEGSPNALLEAMAMERPVVATRVGGLAETVEHGVDGFLVRHDDAAGFAHYLVALLERPELRLRLGQAGRAAVLRRHDDRAVALRLAALFREVGAQAHPARA